MEIVTKERDGVKLTITPTRVTLKFPNEFKEEDKSRFIELAEKVKASIVPLEQAWRGKFKTNHITLVSNGNNKKHTFNY